MYVLCNNEPNGNFFHQMVSNRWRSTLSIVQQYIDVLLQSLNNTNLDLRLLNVVMECSPMPMIS